MAASVPTYRLHKPTNQAVVRLNGRDFYLGKHGSPESRAEYDRRIAEWLASGRVTPSASSTINELLVAYVQHIDSYYIKNGEPTGEADNIKRSLRPLRELYGHTVAADFGPLALKAFRERLMKPTETDGWGNLCRSEINRRVSHIRRFFRFCVQNEYVPLSLVHGLEAVADLKKGRGDVREADPIKPVPIAHIEAIRDHLTPMLWAMVQIQLLTGMRPGEITIMTTRDISVGGKLWRYRPESHKTEHHGRVREIMIGPKAQEHLRPYLNPNLEEYIFSPSRSETERLAKMREERKTPVQPSQRNRAKKGRLAKMGERYEVAAYAQAIARACQSANVPRWSPNRLRHNAATLLRRECSLDTARAVLGHSTPIVTEVYAEMDEAKAADAMLKFG